MACNLYSFMVNIFFLMLFWKIMLLLHLSSAERWNRVSKCFIVNKPYVCVCVGVCVKSKKGGSKKWRGKCKVGVWVASMFTIGTTSILLALLLVPRPSLSVLNTHFHIHTHTHTHLIQCHHDQSQLIQTLPSLLLLH